MKRKQESEGDGVGIGFLFNLNLGDGSSWVRGPLIGKGSFGSVFAARLRESRSKFIGLPPIMAVKSAEVSLSATLQKEKEVLCNLLASGCPNLVYCFGDEITVSKSGQMFYNLLLEFASAGTLASLIHKCASCGGSVPESDVRRYTRALLRALNHIHSCGYVHCDLKPDNVLLFPVPAPATSGSDSNSVKLVAKIADFGLAKRATTAAAGKRRRLDPPNSLRGTALYFSPEAVADGLQEAAADIWALGCVVLEMLTGKPPWGPVEDLNREILLFIIGSGLRLPEIPDDISSEARDFLKGCLVCKPMYRWTAEMLLNHPFVSGIDDDDEEESDQDIESELCDSDDYFEEEEGFSSSNGLLLSESETNDELGSYSSIYSSYSSLDSASSTVVDHHHIY